MARMTNSFGAAMEALDRAATRPTEYCRPFVELFPVTGASVSTLGDVPRQRDAVGERRRGRPPRRVAVRPRRGPVLGCRALGTRRCSSPTSLAVGSATAGRRSREAMRDVDRCSSIFAFPLAVGPLRIGAVDLYSLETGRPRPGRRRSRPTRWPRSSAGTCSGRRWARSGATTTSTATPYSRRMVHQATGMVLAQLGISADDARLVIQGHAFADVAIDDGGRAGHRRRSTRTSADEYDGIEALS